MLCCLYWQIQSGISESLFKLFLHTNSTSFIEWPRNQNKHKNHMGRSKKTAPRMRLTLMLRNYKRSKLRKLWQTWSLSLSLPLCIKWHVLNREGRETNIFLFPKANLRFIKNMGQRALFSGFSDSLKKDLKYLNPPSWIQPLDGSWNRAESLKFIRSWH